MKKRGRTDSKKTKASSLAKVSSKKPVKSNSNSKKSIAKPRLTKSSKKLSKTSKSKSLSKTKILSKSKTSDKVKSHSKPVKHHKVKRKKPSFLQREEKKLKHLEEEFKDEFFVPSPIHKGKYHIPLGIKLLIGYLIFLLSLYLLSFWQGITFPTSILFGTVVSGVRALVINSALVILLVLMIYGFWMRKAYTFDLSVAWFGFALVNSLLSLLLLDSKEYMVFKGLLYLSLFTLLLVNGVIIWYILHEKKYFYAEYFRERKVQHRDKVFVYVVTSFWIVTLLIGITLGANFYQRSTAMVDITINELKEVESVSPDFCEQKTGEAKDICLLVITTYRNTQLGESKAELLPVCEKVGSEFYKFACKKSLEKNTKNAK
ncbi:hypothetical protein HN587_03740 [Candidatus Woesearchaeota archaeon]|jgi:hypothetical protein|nr:hypothetical protein [Candidatus Woesearchaeota archaeon]